MEALCLDRQRAENNRAPWRFFLEKNETEERHETICMRRRGTGATDGTGNCPGEMPEAGASAAMIDLDGNNVGTVTFTQTASGILHIFVEMTGLPPGPRGFHIHEVGACDPEDGFESAAAHFAAATRSMASTVPTAACRRPAQRPYRPGRHPEGRSSSPSACRSRRTENSLLGGDGTAVILHDEPDDYATDPHGHAGDRIACGVIEPV
jgi:superoxide dismutase, Cu-Zn family